MAAAHQREHRARAYKAQYQRDSRNEARSLIRAAKSAPCTDCGVKLPPEVMDLDHVRGDKAFNFGKLHKIAGAGPAFVQKVRDEIAKCEPCCPNCHRMRHYRARSGMMG